MILAGFPQFVQIPVNTAMSMQDDGNFGNSGTDSRVCCAFRTPNCQMTAKNHPDRLADMTGSSFRTHALILAAYLLATVLPMLILAEGRQQSQAVHQQTMVMAGHVAPMSSPGTPIDETQLLLCQQHCVFAIAVIPGPKAAAIERSARLSLSDDLLAASLAIPPPGPPPKFALI